MLSIYLWLVVVALAITATTASTASLPSTKLTIAVTQSNLLSGGLTGCEPFFNNSYCRRGLAEALYWRRKECPDASAFLPVVDYGDAFVQMHPKEWGVNGVVYKHFGIPAFLSTHALLNPPPKQWKNPGLESARFLISNGLIDGSNPWFGNVASFLFNETTGVATIYGLETDQPGSVPLDTAVLGIVSQLNADSRVKFIAVLFKGYNVTLMAEKIAAANKTVAVIVDLRSSKTPVKVGDTWVGGAFIGYKSFNIVEFEGYDSSSASVPAALKGRAKTLVLRSFSLSISASDRLADPAYVADQTYMQSLVAEAKSNNPTIGTALQTMPVTRTGSWRYCFRGNCELGNLWSDAMEWKGQSDVSFIVSGGIRGYGWPAGPIKISNIFDSDPFRNELCKGTLLGLTLMRLFNFSVTSADFVSHFTQTGDRLLQPSSNLRVTYNLQNDRSRRLVSVEVKNKKTGLFEQVERTAKYTYTTVSYVCDVFDEFPSILREGLTGEVGPIAMPDIIQNVVADYLTAHNPYSIPTPNRLVNDTTVSASAAPATLALLKTAADCLTTERWEAAVKSCVACPTGLVKSSVDPSKCTQQSSDSSGLSTAVIIAVVVVGLAVVVALVVGISVLACRKGDVRDVRNAPRENPITIMFTDIENSTLLWSHAPQSMAEALSIHHAILRDCIATHNAYEVKTAGDAFMIACKSSTAAVELAAEIQMRLLRCSWPTAIDSVYTAVAAQLEPAVIDDPTSTSEFSQGMMWHGLRVRVGMHTGECEVQWDAVAKGYDYYGPPVNAAARVESVTRGGEICCSASVVAALNESAAKGLGASYKVADSSMVSNNANGDMKSAATKKFAITSRGEFELKGINHPVEVCRVMPHEIADRKFADLAVKNDGVDAGGMSAFDSDMTGQTPEFSDNGSIASSAVSAAMFPAALVDQLSFFHASLRALKDKDRQRVIQAYAQAWRVNTKSSDRTITGIVKRVGAVWQQQQATGGAGVPVSGTAALLSIPGRSGVQLSTSNRTTGSSANSGAAGAQNGGSTPPSTYTQKVPTVPGMHGLPADPGLLNFSTLRTDISPRGGADGYSSPGIVLPPVPTNGDEDAAAAPPPCAAADAPPGQVPLSPANATLGLPGGGAGAMRQDSSMSGGSALRQMSSASGMQQSQMSMRMSDLESSQRSGSGSNAFFSKGLETTGRSRVLEMSAARRGSNASKSLGK